MNSLKVVRGQRVVSKRYKISGTVQEIVQDPYQPQVKLLRILVDGERLASEWHPEHWESIRNDHG